MAQLLTTAGTALFTSSLPTSRFPVFRLPTLSFPTTELTKNTTRRKTPSQNIGVLLLGGARQEWRKRKKKWASARPEPKTGNRCVKMQRWVRKRRVEKQGVETKGLPKAKGAPRLRGGRRPPPTSSPRPGDIASLSLSSVTSSPRVPLAYAPSSDSVSDSISSEVSVEEQGVVGQTWSGKSLDVTAAATPPRSASAPLSAFFDHPESSEEESGSNSSSAGAYHPDGSDSLEEDSGSNSYSTGADHPDGSDSLGKTRDPIRLRRAPTI